MTRLFLDANIFLYAIGGESPHRQSCRDLVDSVSSGALEGLTSTEVLQEVLHVRSRRMGVADGVAAVRAASGLVREVLPVTKEDILVACELLVRYQALRARDAVHAAVMQNSSLTLIASVDADFDTLKEVKRLTPADALGLVG